MYHVIHKSTSTAFEKNSEAVDYAVKLTKESYNNENLSDSGSYARIYSTHTDASTMIPVYKIYNGRIIED